MDTQKQQKLFDVADYSKKVLESLGRLESTQRPGEHVGLGGKGVVLEQAKTEILALLKKGYTVKQIATALTADVFGILPKSITQLIKPTVTKTRKTKQKRVTNKELKQADATQAIQQVMPSSEPNMDGSV